MRRTICRIFDVRFIIGGYGYGYDYDYGYKLILIMQVLNIFTVYLLFFYFFIYLFDVCTWVINIASNQFEICFPF